MLIFKIINKIDKYLLDVYGAMFVKMISVSPFVHIAVACGWLCGSLPQSPVTSFFGRKKKRKAEILVSRSVVIFESPFKLTINGG